MPYTYLEEAATADIAFIATGSSLKELFQTAADAVLNVMIEDLETIALRETRPYQGENRDLELLLFDFLNEIIYYKDAEQLLLRAPIVAIEKIKDIYRISAAFKGEALDPERHPQRVDVKAVTLHQFEVSKKDGEWIAKVILDI